MVLRWVLAILVVMAGATSAAAQDKLVAVPLVGCPAIGQELEEPPTDVKTPLLPAPLAARLAWYASFDQGVLAPRGWQCSEGYGSYGSNLFVTPGPEHDSYLNENKLKGPFVSLLNYFSFTSGRMGFVEIGAPLFPRLKPFADFIEKEWKAKLEFVSIANDKLVRRGSNIVQFVTPAGKDGLGTDGQIEKNSTPVSGVVVITSGEYSSLALLRARLPAELRDLASVIIEQQIRDTQCKQSCSR